MTEGGHGGERGVGNESRHLWKLLAFAVLAGVACDPKDKPKGEDSTIEDSDSGEPDTDEHTADSVETGDTNTDSGETGLETGDTADTHAPVNVDLDESAWLTMYSLRAGALFGDPYVLYDVTGDGADDFCFAYFSDLLCYGFSSPIPEGLYLAEEGDFLVDFGRSHDLSTPGDIDGDGVADLGLGPHVVLGPIMDEESEKTADITILYDEDDWYVYSDQINRGDSNADGLDDLILVFWEGKALHHRSGDTLYKLYLGLDSPTDSFDAADATLISEESFPGPVGFLGDTNGDGFDDIMYRGWIALGPVYGDITESDIILGGGLSAGDVNGDGYDDVMYNGSLGGIEPPVVSILLAPFEEPVSYDTADATLMVEGSDFYDHVPSLTSTGDQDGDALPDVAFAFSDQESGYLDRLFLFSTPFEGTHTDADATMVLQSSRERLDLTYMDGPGDFLGDGSANDFLIGDKRHSSYSGNAGIGWVMVSGSFP